ncbi:MAG: glycosyltransferase [Chitinophagaceae bacterium]
MRSEKKDKYPVSAYFIVPAPEGISPGQRFRFEHYLKYMPENNIRYKISAFYTLTGWKSLFVPGNYFKKTLIVIRGFLKRIIDLLRLVRYDYVFIYREAGPVGPPVIEWIVAKLFRKKIIYDFDDAIWIPASSQYNKVARFVKNFGKVKVICKWAHKVSVGNDYLMEYAAKYNKQVTVVPTVVDTEEVHNHLQNQQTYFPAIGWTGTFSTLKYLDIVLPALQRLQQKFDFTFIVIADRDPQLKLKNYRFIPWKKGSETADLLTMHIGLMPLYDDDLSKGKCGFKAIQYMALGIPAIASPVGVNSIIVKDGIHGYICKDEKEWEEKITVLLKDVGLRKQFGVAARKRIQDHYSVHATKNMFIQLFT